MCYLHTPGGYFVRQMTMHAIYFEQMWYTNYMLYIVKFSSTSQNLRGPTTVCTKEVEDAYDQLFVPSCLVVFSDTNKR